MSNAARENGLVVPDYATKPVTFLQEVVLNALSFVDRGANSQRWLIFKSEDGAGTDSLHEVTELIKSYDPTKSDSWETAFIVVAEPGVVDKQRDMWGPDEIRRAAHQ